MLFNVDNLEQSSIELKLYKRSGYPKMNVPETCSHHNTGIKLLLSVGTTTMQLASSVVITNQDIQDGKWIGFGSLSKFFKNIQHTVKVSIEGRSMCNNQIVDLNKIGVFDGKEMMAVLVMYSHKSDNMRQAMDKVVVADRTRRNAGSGEASLPSPSLGITAPCRLVKYNVSILVSVMSYMAIDCDVKIYYLFLILYSFLWRTYLYQQIPHWCHHTYMRGIFVLVTVFIQFPTQSHRTFTVLYRLVSA